MEFVLKHAGDDPVSFHMPGHKGSGIFRRYGYGDYLDRILECDITEIPGADNLFQAEGIIKDVQDRYAKLYGAKRSFLLVNGTSGGIIASILATVRPGGKLIMARNCHKSVFNALSLAGAKPVYAAPEYIGEYGISGAVSAEEIERCLDAHPDADAVILPSPNYYGICSDIRAIADTVHRRGKPLIVDQAHGAHLKAFSEYGYDMPPSAEEAGADISINSIHKTLASITQSAVLNINSDRVDAFSVEDRLQMIETTSPSYIMMAFLDINCGILEEHGREAIGEWYDGLAEFSRGLAGIDGLKVVEWDGMDRTKVCIDMSAYGLDGAQLERELNERGIFPELYAGNMLMLMTGIGNTRDDYSRTLDALRNIAGEREQVNSEDRRRGTGFNMPDSGRIEKIPDEKIMVPLKDAEGMVCAVSVIPYPPGIPVVCPGEVFTADIIGYIRQLRDAGEKVIGISGDGLVAVGKEERNERE